MSNLNITVNRNFVGSFDTVTAQIPDNQAATVIVPVMKSVEAGFPSYVTGEPIEKLLGKELADFYRVLGVAGATVALMLGNIDKVIGSIGRWYVVASLTLTLLSGLFGLAARFHSYQALMISNLWGDAPERLAKIRERYEAEAKSTYGAVLPMRSEVIEGVSRQIVPASVDQMSFIGRVMWRSADGSLASLQARRRIYRSSTRSTMQRRALSFGRQASCNALCGKC